MRIRGYTYWNHTVVSVSVLCSNMTTTKSITPYLCFWWAFACWRSRLHRRLSGSQLFGPRTVHRVVLAKLNDCCSRSRNVGCLRQITRPLSRQFPLPLPPAQNQTTQQHLYDGLLSDICEEITVTRKFCTTKYSSFVPSLVTTHTVSTWGKERKEQGTRGTVCGMGGGSIPAIDTSCLFCRLGQCDAFVSPHNTFRQADNEQK